MPAKILGFKPSKAFEIRAKGPTKAEIIIYDVIGFDWWTGGGVTAKSFSDELKNIDASVNEIDVRINSPGGDVFDGIAIYNRLKQVKAKKTVYIDGLAASIASIIALAGDEIIMGEGALYMIHLPWTMAMGNRMELDNTIQRLADVEEQLINIYYARTKIDKNEIRKMLEDETWLDADQAREKGFVDKTMEESMPIAASALKGKHIRRSPENYFSQKLATKNSIKTLEDEIKGTLARK